MTAIQWTNEQRKLSEMIPWVDNPRDLDDGGWDFLDESFEIFGYAEPILLGPNNHVYNGHQRIKVLLKKFGEDHIVDVRVSDRPLTTDEQKQLTIFFHESVVGDWDYDKMFAIFEKDELTAYGFPEWKLPDPDELADLDDLEEQYGDYDEEDYWPVIRVTVPPDVFKDWNGLMEILEGGND